MATVRKSDDGPVLPAMISLVSRSLKLLCGVVPRTTMTPVSLLRLPSQLNLRAS